jgi:hypothetical protein
MEENWLKQNVIIYITVIEVTIKSHNKIQSHCTLNMYW